MDNFRKALGKISERHSEQFQKDTRNNFRKAVSELFKKIILTFVPPHELEIFE